MPELLRAHKSPSPLRDHQNPILYQQCVSSLTASHRIYMWKGCEREPTVYCPYPREGCKVQPFADVISKAALSAQLVYVQPGFEPAA